VQVWIAQHLESAVNNYLDTTAIRRYINWTVSYRRDSTVYWPFYANEKIFVRREVTDKTRPVINYAAGRTRLVAWLASNSRDHNGRRNYVKELSRQADTLWLIKNRLPFAVEVYYYITVKTIFSKKNLDSIILFCRLASFFSFSPALVSKLSLGLFAPNLAQICLLTYGYNSEARSQIFRK
jgi:hypothetical protein